MAIAWLMACVLSVSAHGLTVRLAPDQPLPMAYVDEPLVVELIHDRDTTVAVTLEATGPGAAGVTVQWEAVRLNANAPRWLVAEDFPKTLGLYRVTVTVEDMDSVTGTVCRVERATQLRDVSAYAMASTNTIGEVRALRALPVPMIQLDSGAEDVNTLMESALAQGMALSMKVDADFDGIEAGALEALARIASGRTDLWELDGAHFTGRFIQYAQTIRQLDEDARIGASINTAEQLGTLIEDGGGAVLTDVVIRGKSVSLDAVRMAAERAGREGLRYTAAIPPTGEQPASAIEAVSRLASGYALVALPGGAVFEEGAFTDRFPEWSALLSNLEQATYIGPLPVAEGVQAHAFQVNDPGESAYRWRLVCWPAASDTVALPPLDGFETVTDGWNNPAESTANEEGIVVSASAWPVYLSGSGGSVVAAAACERTREAASAVAGFPAFDTALDATARDAVTAFTQCEPGASQREQFHHLLRAIVELEGAWHEGSAPMADALPLIAGLARLARAVATSEHESGVPFLDPLAETLSRCGEYQSLYITSTGFAKGGDGRGDWLLDEIGRLSAEAQQLSARRRAIEASAVAALAEWRARSLQTLSRKASPAPAQRPANE